MSRNINVFSSAPRFSRSLLFLVLGGCPVMEECPMDMKDSFTNTGDATGGPTTSETDSFTTSDATSGTATTSLDSSTTEMLTTVATTAETGGMCDGVKDLAQCDEKGFDDLDDCNGGFCTICSGECICPEGKATNPITQKYCMGCDETNHYTMVDGTPENPICSDLPEGLFIQGFDEEGVTYDMPTKYQLDVYPDLVETSYIVYWMNNDDDIPIATPCFGEAYKVLWQCDLFFPDNVVGVEQHLTFWAENAKAEPGPNEYRIFLPSF